VFIQLNEIINGIISGAFFRSATGILVVAVVLTILYFYHYGYRPWRKMCMYVEKISPQYGMHLEESTTFFSFFSKRYSGILYEHQRLEVCIKLDLSAQNVVRHISILIVLFLNKKNPFIMDISNRSFLDRVLVSKHYGLLKLDNEKFNSKISIFTPYEETETIKEILDGELQNLLLNFKEIGSIKVDEETISFRETGRCLEKEIIINTIEIIKRLAMNIEKLQEKIAMMKQN